MKKITIIGCYFGKFNKDINLWLKSCKNNPTIDWLIFTDDQIADLPSNVKIVKSSLEEIKSLMESKFGFDIVLDSPYKLCDYKVMYGYIFKDYLKDTDFWGHCDFDMVFGDLRKFVTDDVLDKYDKIFPLGHLSLYRNTQEVNMRFTQSGSKHNYKEVLQTSMNCCFDEIIGLYLIYKKHNYDIKYIEVLDIGNLSKKIRKTQIQKSFGLPAVNRRYQTFVYDNGKVFEIYFEDNNKYVVEYPYIHLSKRKLVTNDDVLNSDIFAFTPDGCKKIASIDDITINNIGKFNKTYPIFIDNIIYRFNWEIRKIKRKINKLKYK